MCCCRPEYRKTLRDVEQERSPRLPGVLPGGRRHHGSETQNSKATGLARPVMPCSRPIKWLPAGSWDKILCNSQASWVMAGGFDWEDKGFTSVGSAPSSGLKSWYCMDGHLQLHQNDGANNWPTGKPGASCPLDPHDDLAHDPRFH